MFKCAIHVIVAISGPSVTSTPTNSSNTTTLSSISGTPGELLNTQSLSADIGPTILHIRITLKMCLIMYRVHTNSSPSYVSSRVHVTSNSDEPFDLHLKLSFNSGSRDYAALIIMQQRSPLVPIGM